MRIRSMTASVAALAFAIPLTPAAPAAATSSPIAPVTVLVERPRGLSFGITDAQFGPDGTLYVASTDTEAGNPELLEAFTRLAPPAVAYASSPISVTLPSGVLETKGMAVSPDGTKLALAYRSGPPESDGAYESGVLVYDLPLTNAAQPARTITGPVLANPRVDTPSTGMNTASTLAWDRLGNLWVNGWSPDGLWYSVYVYGATANGTAAPLKRLDISTSQEPAEVLLAPDNRLRLPVFTSSRQVWSLRGYPYDTTATPAPLGPIPAEAIVTPPSPPGIQYWAGDALGRVVYAITTDDPALSAAPWEVRAYGPAIANGAPPFSTTTVTRGPEVSSAVWNGYYGTGAWIPYLRFDPSDGSLVILTSVRNRDAGNRRFFYYMDRYATSTDPTSTSAIVLPAATMPPLPPAIAGSTPEPTPAPEPAPGPSVPVPGGAEASPAQSAEPAPSAVPSAPVAPTAPSASGGVSVPIPVGPVAAGVEVLGPVTQRAAVVRPATTAAGSPRLRVPRGKPAVVQLSGLRPGAALAVQVNVRGAVASLGTLVVGSDGRVSLPPLRLSQRGTVMLVVTDPADGSQRFVRLVIPPAAAGARTAR